MNTKVIEIIGQKNYVVPSFLLKNYKSLNITCSNLILLIYLLNLDRPIVCDYEKFSKELNMDLKEVMNEINNLVEAKLIEINLEKNKSSKLEEFIDLDLLFNKIFLNLIDVNDEKKETNIYSKFEEELKRSLSPIEYELINGWLECNYKEEIILAALKEAVFNGVNNFRYIDKILFEWHKKGIDTLEKIEKNRKEFKENRVDVPDYDWLNDE